MGSVIADELIRSVNDHLWGVDPVARAGGGVLVLAVGVLVGGETVVPAALVPVVDVLFEHDDLGVIDGLIVVQLCEQSVGWRAARAALGGEELHQDRRPCRIWPVCAAACGWVSTMTIARSATMGSKRYCDGAKAGDVATWTVPLWS